ncbi:MAG: MBOAT family O-acyltransferase [Syntrophomonadaceae bacterium]|nr:MBOAT family O-acyltransferase [Syntrophomonadaceae bacterium]
MLFHTPEFMLFMLAVFVLYYFLPGCRLYILAAADMIFYAVGGIGYLALFMAIATITWLLSQRLQGDNRKIILILGICLNTANLIFFKYTFFIMANMEKILAVPLMNQLPLFQHLVLPIGISFYTFELIAYLVDVYHGKISPARSWMVFWVFISFFPHRVAGPIMRGKDLIGQIGRLQDIAVRNTVPLGLAYLGMGLVKKIILADYIAGWANNLLAAGSNINSTGALAAAYLYTFQIYYDFSAYSEMAIGIGYLLGIKLVLNFQTPYLSANATEFWKRWHISLSEWIRDYIYIPLGGSWHGNKRKYVNLFIAMAISGLWHGAAWAFVIWGMYHGLLLIIHNIYGKWKKPPWWARISGTRFCHVLSVLVFFQFVAAGWVFFRINNITDAAHIIFKMMTFNPLHPDPNLVKYLVVAMILFILHLVERWARHNYQRLAEIWQKYFPAPIRALAYTVLIITLVVCMQTEQSSFIYFQF